MLIQCFLPDYHRSQIVLKLNKIIELEYNILKKPIHLPVIEDPRSKQRGIFDPQLGILYFMLANPAASNGECARGDSIPFS